MGDPGKNDYLEQVMEKQQRLESDLRTKRAPPSSMPNQMVAQQAMNAPAPARRAALAAPQQEPSGSAVDVRITGFWRWRTVIVPPNAHVVHTRRGHPEPLHLGLGVSFGFNPFTDSFLVVPGAMQTILINAYCICRELQGLLVQGYVQWIIADFATAYRKLDFSDSEDPMRVVNVQMREQAEAAIKDKVATMGIDAVLSDKEPIIEELTARLRQVAEGAGGTDKGLGLRIVTVQIKEAVVSSARLWENLQQPFRSERGRVARLAELEASTLIKTRELEVQKANDTAKLETEAELATLRAKKEAEAYDREQGERLRREEREQADARALADERQRTALQAAELDKARLAAEAEVARQRLAEEGAQARLAAEARVAVEELQRVAANRQTQAELGFSELQQRIAGSVTPEQVRARLVEMLPAVADKLPKPTELRSIQIGGEAGAHEGQALSSLVAQLLSVVETVRPRGKGETSGTR